MENPGLLKDYDELELVLNLPCSIQVNKQLWEHPVVGVGLWFLGEQNILSALKQNLLW